MNTLAIRPRVSTVQPIDLGDHLRLQGEVPWYLEGPAELIQQAAAALAGVCERITAEVLLVNFRNSVGWFRVPSLGLVEVVSGKWESGHFDAMLLDLSIWASALPFSMGGGSVGVAWNAADQQTVLYHAFAYLRSVLSEHIPPEFRLMDAIHTVMRDPHRQLERVRREVPLAAVRQVAPSLLENLAAGHYPLVRLDSSHQHQPPFVRHLRGYIPEYVGDDQGEITFDTPENRFVKAFLDYALTIISQMHQFIESVPAENKSAFQRRLLEEAEHMEYLLRPSRRHALWKEIGSMVHVPVSSTVLSTVNYLGPPYGNYFCRFLNGDLGFCLLKLSVVVGFGGTITLDLHHIQNDGMMDDAIYGRHRRHRILECVIMPLSLIALLVEAILEDVLCLLLLNIPSRACLWLAGIQ